MAVSISPSIEHLSKLYDDQHKTDDRQDAFMAGPASSTHSHALALATSQIHRCKRLEDLQQVYLQTIPQVVNADAFGMYLFDDRQQIEAIFSSQANQHFLDE